MTTVLGFTTLFSFLSLSSYFHHMHSWPERKNWPFFNNAKRNLFSLFLLFVFHTYLFIIRSSKEGSMSETSSIVNKLATPLALLFNTFVLVQLHGASASNVGEDSNQSIVSSFLNRMKENGVENMETMDMVFCGCVAMMGMEALNIFTKKLGSKCIFD